MSDLSPRSRPRIPVLALSAAALAVAGCAGHAPAAVRPERAVQAVHVQHADAADGPVATQVRGVLAAAAGAAERWGPLRKPVTITIHPTHAALEAAARRPDHGWLRAWARAEAIELQSPRTWSSGAVSDEDLEQLLAHELAHCAMYQAIGGEPEVARTIPIWFREGMASVAAGERYAPAPGALPQRTLSWSAAAYRTSSSLVYASADAAFRVLLDRHGDAAIRRLLARMRGGAPFPEAFRDATGVTVERFEDEFGRSAGRAASEG